MNETSLNKDILKLNNTSIDVFANQMNSFIITPMARTCFVLQQFMSRHVCMNLPQFPLKIEVNTLSGIRCI